MNRLPPMLPGYFHIDQRVKSQKEMILVLYKLPLIMRVFFLFYEQHRDPYFDEDYAMS